MSAVSSLPAPESMAAHDALLIAYITWRGEDGLFEAAPTPVNAAKADLAWLLLVTHAENAGCRMAQPDILGWVRRRLVNYAALMGREPVS